MNVVGTEIQKFKREQVPCDKQITLVGALVLYITTAVTKSVIITTTHTRQGTLRPVGWDLPQVCAMET